MSEFRSPLITGLAIVALGLALPAWAQVSAGASPRNLRIVGPEGVPVEGRRPSLSDDGRFVAFVSSATLVPGDDNQRDDVFVYDRTTRTIERIAGEIQLDAVISHADAPDISGNGRVVTFTFRTWRNDGSYSSIVYVHDRVSRETVRVAAGRAPSINGDGRYLAFESDDATLVPDTNEASDVFVFDRITKAITRASVTRLNDDPNAGSFAPTLSANGRKLLFRSQATNLLSLNTPNQPDLFLKDLRTGTISPLNVGPLDAAVLNADGRLVVFTSGASNLVPGDTNDAPDIFVRDLAAGTTTRVSVDSFGRQANDGSYDPLTNASGRYVVFRSYATNLVRDVPVDSAILLHDRRTGVTRQVDLDDDGHPADEPLFLGDYAFSGNGRFFAMSTSAALAEDDASGALDLYVRDLGTLSLAARFDTIASTLLDVSAPGMLQTALASARAGSDDGDRTAACRAMTRFEREVQARWNRDVPTAQAEALFTAAGVVGRELGCLGTPGSVKEFFAWTVTVAEADVRRRASTCDRCGNVFTGDVDGDGLLDVVTDAATTIIVLAGDGAGSFLTRVDTRITGVIRAAADLNGDGRTDLVVSNEDEYAVRILISERTGAVAFSEMPITLEERPTSVAIGDLTGDGHADIVVGNDRLATATLIAGSGSGQFTGSHPIDTGYSPSRVALGDITGDGHLDLVYQSFPFLFLARGTGVGLPLPAEYLQPAGGDFRLADVDGDNTPEVISWHGQRADVYRFDSGLRLVSTIAGRPIWNLSVADLTDDQRADLVILEPSDFNARAASFSIVHGNGDGTFGTREALSTRVTSGGFTLGDMNRDGRADLVVAVDADARRSYIGPAGVSVVLNRPGVFIETPNGKTVVGIGTTLPLSWLHTLPAGTAFRVDVSRDGGKTWATVVPRIAARGSNGRYSWTVTGPVTTRARFRVTSLGSVPASDVNNASFSIAEPSMKLHAPRAGENWAIGSDRRLAWSHDLGASERVHVDLSRDDGRTWTRIASNVRLNGTTSAQLAMVPTAPETTTARVRVSWSRDPSVAAVSDAFRIGIPFLRIVEPTPGTGFPRCTYLPLTWRHNLGTREHMDVAISYDAGGTWGPVWSLANNGATRSIASLWVAGPAVKTGMVRITWKKDDAVTATVANLALGHDEGYSCEPDEE